MASQTLFQLAPTIQTRLQPSPTLAINERVTQLWAAGQTVYHLGFGEARFPVHPKLLTALTEHGHQNSYLPTLGLPELRAQVADFYNRHFGFGATMNQVIVAPGSKPLLYALQMALAADLILPTPSWVSYGPQAHLLGRAVYQIPATPADGYALTIDALDQTVRQSSNPAKLLVLNSPSNPTGQMLTEPFLRDLADYCRQTGLLILSDEIYALVPHGHRPHRSPAEFYPEGTVVFGGLSKHLSLGGWRLGVAIVPSTAEGMQLMSALRVIAGEVWSTTAAPVQYAAMTAYSNDPALTAYIEEGAHIHAIRTQHLWSWLVELGVPCAQPDGGFYMFPNFEPWRAPLAQRGVTTSTELAAYLLDQYQIATLPGTAFGAPPTDLSLRLATSYLDMETEAKAQQLLTAYRHDPTPEVFLRDHHPMTQGAIDQFRRWLGELNG